MGVDKFWPETAWEQLHQQEDNLFFFFFPLFLGEKFTEPEYTTETAVQVIDHFYIWIFPTWLMDWFTNGLNSLHSCWQPQSAHAENVSHI